MFCLRGASLVIGLWDLLVHSIALCVLIFMFGQSPRVINDHNTAQLSPVLVDPYPGSSSSNVMLNNKNFVSGNLLLNRIREKYNATYPTIEINARNFYSHLNIMTIKWAQSLSQRMLHKNISIRLKKKLSFFL